MSAVAAGVTTPPSARRRSGALPVVVVSMMSVVSFVGLHAGDRPYPQFQGACERLRDAGLTITAQDAFCRPLPWTAQAGTVAAMLLFAAGFVVACAVLAATGRRATAFLPFLAVPLASLSGAGLISGEWWHMSSWLGGAAMVLVVGAPVAAVAYSVRGRRRFDGERLSVGAGVASGVAVMVASVAVAFVGRAVLAHHFGSNASDMSFDGIVAGAIGMAVFGALLGPDRRWWPWSLAIPAILLSMGPSFALIDGEQHLHDWSQFGVVLPLSAIGLIASAWRPLALWLMRFGDIPQGERGATPDAEPSVSSRRIRPVVAFNAAAAGLLAVSLIIFRADPGPIQLATALPTYLGARNVVMDVRTKLDLRSAIDVMDAYRTDHGSYQGFDAVVGRAAYPSLVWMDGLPSEASVFGDDEPDVAIVSATSMQAAVVGLSGSGTAFCVQRSAGELSYGSGETPDVAPPSGVTALQAAATACGSTRWSAAAVRRFPIDGMCDGLDRVGGYLICRMVQALMANTMRRS